MNIKTNQQGQIPRAKHFSNTHAVVTVPRQRAYGHTTTTTYHT